MAVNVLKYTNDFYHLCIAVGRLVWGLGRLQRFRVFDRNTCVQIIKTV